MTNFNRKRDKIAVHQKKKKKNELLKIINIWKCFETLMVRFVRVLAIAF